MPSATVSPAASSIGDGSRVSEVVSIAGPVVSAIAAGLAAWLLVTPGESLLGPLLVAGVIIVVSTCAARLWLSSLKTQRRLVISAVVLGAVALLWTYFGVLPASIAWDAGAAHKAQQVIRAGGSDGCHLVKEGSIGFLDAPYQLCTYDGPAGRRIQMVRFSPADDASRGYFYLAFGSAAGWFPDMCARHLVGRWWSFAVPTGATASCPLGYGFHGGG